MDENLLRVTTPLVLFVEDEMMIAMAVEDILHEAGYDVVHCATGTAGIAELEKRAKDFQTVFTDILLPGANGWQVGRRARELHPRIGLVYASGNSGLDWENAGLPGSLFLQKPYSNRDLVLAMTKASWD